VLRYLRSVLSTVTGEYCYPTSPWWWWKQAALNVDKFLPDFSAQQPSSHLHTCQRQSLKGCSYSINLKELERNWSWPDSRNYPGVHLKKSHTNSLLTQLLFSSDSILGSFRYVTASFSSLNFVECWVEILQYILSDIKFSEILSYIRPVARLMLLRNISTFAPSTKP
jgi:hypothetical protein